ncbi:VOC family protein [Hamadaea tsunoensis]|uniref:VOC family protein n=1 Tax=Hamadaea tsunoensis TaxID=53368 RepID=UPI000413A2B1|nr:VOC family protein [Hamadaea tsunoensis]
MFTAPQVNIYSADVLRAVAFYCGFGFRETFRTPRDGVPIHVELRLDGFTIGVASAASAVADHGLDLGGDARGMEIVLWTDDTDGAYARLVAAGAPSLSAPKDWLGNLRVAWVADPDGNPVELVQRRRT